MVELDQQLTTSQLIPQVAQEQERTRLLEKIVEDFKSVCDLMDTICKDTSQHVEDVCRMKLEVSQMRGKAALESHEAVSIRDMIQKDRDAINRIINVVKEVKDYTDSLGQIEVLRERLRSMDLRISELQMRPSTHALEDRLARLEDRLQDQHEEIVSELVLTPFRSVPIRNLISLSPRLTSISLYCFQYLPSGSTRPVSPRYTLDCVVRFLCLPLQTLFRSYLRPASDPRWTCSYVSFRHVTSLDMFLIERSSRSGL